MEKPIEYREAMLLSKVALLEQTRIEKVLNRIDYKIDNKLPLTASELQELGL